MPPPDSTPDLQRPAGPGALFTAFTLLALQGFGGVLPLAQRELVERRRWLSREDFLELLSVGQVLPGPNVVNLSLMVGDRFFGWRGAVAALAGMLGAPLGIVLTLAALYAQTAQIPAVSGALRGMAAVSAGLIVAMGLKLLPALARNPIGQLAGVSIAAATLAAVGGARLSMVMVVGLLGPLSIAWAWRRLGARPSARPTAEGEGDGRP